MTRPSEAAAIEAQQMVLLETLRLAVPMHIEELNGLPLDVLASIASASATTVGTHGDDLQFGGAYCAETFNALARGLAAAALLAQGGIDYMGLHWCAIPHCRASGRFDHADDPEPEPWPEVPDPPPPRPVRTLTGLDAWL